MAAKETLIKLALTLILCPLLSGVKSAIAESVEQAPYKIGAILPLSGAYASLGNYLKKGIDLAYQKLPAEDQALIQIIYEDDQLSAPKAVSAFHKLTRVNNVDSVFVLGSGIGNAIAPLAERSKKLMISIGASDTGFVQDRDFVFIHWVSPHTEAQVMLAEIEKRGYSRLALVTSEQEGALALERALLTEAEKRGTDSIFLLKERFLTEDRDFKTFIARARARRVDGIAVVLMPGSLAAFAKQVRDHRLDSELFGFELFEDDNEVRASDGALVGRWYVNADEVSADFQKEYRARYSEQPGWAAGNAYDTLNLVLSGLKEAGRDNLKIAAQLRAVKDYRGAAGLYSATGSNQFSLPATVKLVTAQGFQKLYPDS